MSFDSEVPAADCEGLPGDGDASGDHSVLHDIPEAAQPVLQASSMGRGGEIFILDMGEPMRIVDLARERSRILFTGLRPVEKLYEELLADDETATCTPHPKLRIAQAREVPNHFFDELLPWLMQYRVLADDEVRRDLHRCVPE
jgi:FlaA1/EpsC-like NDP-sugar epimerase